MSDLTSPFSAPHPSSDPVAVPPSGDRESFTPLLSFEIPGMEHKSLDEIIREQGKEDFNIMDHVGELADMWETDEDFYDFLEMCRPGKSGNRPDA